MNLSEFIRQMPKVELHVHVLGAIEPETLLKLAHTHGVELPANSLEGLRQWYTYTDFAHFLEIYLKIAECLRTPDDIELITREFLMAQAALLPPAKKAQLIRRVQAGFQALHAAS
jgi:adenosine deaminase